MKINTGDVIDAKRTYRIKLVELVYDNLDLCYGSRADRLSDRRDYVNGIEDYFILDIDEKHDKSLNEIKRICVHRECDKQLLIYDIF